MIISVDNRVRIPLALLTDEALSDLRKAFTYKNPEFEQARRFMLRGKPPPKFVPTWKTEKTTLTLPRGGLDRACELLDDHKLRYSVDDARCTGDPALAGKIPPLGEHIVPRDFQIAIRDAVLGNETALVRAPTGSGKTTAAFIVAHAVQLATLVIVPTSELFDQWVERLQAELGMPFADIGQIRGPKRKIGAITIGSQKTLATCIDQIAWHFGCVICDEAQRFAATTFLKVVDELPAKFRVGISADERRKDRKEFLVHDVFGPVAYEVKRAKLEDEGIVLDVEVRMVRTDFEAPWYAELREAEDRVRQAKEDDEKPKREDVELLRHGLIESFDRLLVEMGESEPRNNLAVGLALAEVRDGEQVIIFSHRREHCHRLRADIARVEPSSALMLGGPESKREFTAGRHGLRDGSVRVGVGTYQSLGTGIDLPSVGRGVAVTPIHTNRPFCGQVRGRLSRAGKADAVLYYLWDVKVFEAAPLRNMLRWNRTVRVWEEGTWREGREVLKEMDSEAKERREGRDGGTIEDFLAGA